MCDKSGKHDPNCSGCASCAKTRIDLNVWDSEFNMSTYMGRARHYFKLYSICHTFASETKLENARKIIERYRCGDPMNDVSVSQLWKAKYLYDSTFDRYTDDKTIFMGRPATFVPMTAIIGGAMLTYYQRIAPIMFWQWAYQTLQLAINYAERPPNPIVKDSDLMMGYGAGTLSAISTALLYHKMFKCSAPIIARMGPVAAVIVATCISVPVTRYRELQEGIPIYDEKQRKLGYSTKAAQQSVVTDIARELVVQVPPLVLAPFYMEYLDDRGTLCRYPYLNLPNQMLFVGLFTALVTPFLRAIFPAKLSMPFDSLQEELKCCITRKTGFCPERVFFRLDMSPT